MAAMGIESGSVDNRTFSSPTGLAYAFDLWAQKTPSNHGPGWYRWDDQRSAGSPYAVYCNQSSPTPNSKALFLKVSVDVSLERVTFEWYLYWNNSTHTGLGQAGSSILFLTTQSAGFAYYFRGGDDIMMMISRIGSSVYYVRLSKGTGLWGASLKFLEPESTSGVLTNPAYLETDPGGYLSGYHNITGYAANLDANGKLYFSLVNTSGIAYRIDIFKDSARTQLIGQTSTFNNVSTGAKAINGVNSSGLGGSVTLDITAVAATNIDCRFNRLDLGSGQGTNFRVNKWYYLLDFTTGSPLITYLKVLSKSGDQLVVDFVGARPFPAGAYISPYPHRWIFAGTQSQGGGNSSTLPYGSSQGNETSTSACALAQDWMQATLQKVNPDDEGDYPAMNPWCGENNGNRMYFYENEVVLGAPGGLNPLTDRRIIGGVPYITVSVPGAYALLVRDQESLS